MRFPRALPILGLSCSLSLSACTNSAGTEGPEPDYVAIEEVRIVAHRTHSGAYEFRSYDAEQLFRRGTILLKRGQCAAAVEYYDHIAREFSTSRFLSPALYNAGLCFERKGKLAEAARRFEMLIVRTPKSVDVKHARLRLVSLRLELKQLRSALRLSDKLLASDQLSVSERVEVMARRSQALLALERTEEASRQAQATLSYHRSLAEKERLRDTYFIAAANFVLAEILRRSAATLKLNLPSVEAQRLALHRRAELILAAQREYFSTIRWASAEWAAASGFQVGAMYDELWDELMAVPIPESLSEEAKEVYPAELAKMIRPLVRHAVRYWELTLMMIERTGVKSEWAQRIQENLERVRDKLLGKLSGLSGESDAHPN